MARVLRFDAGTLQKPRRTSQGYLRVDGWASRAGAQEYRNPDGTKRIEVRDDDAVFDDESLRGFEGAPITDDHPSEMVTITNAKDLTKGTVLSVGRRDGEHVAVSMVITDPDLIRKIESGKRQLSTGYYVELDETPGVHPKYGRYDARQVRVGPVNHLAFVEKGRAGTAAVRMDAAVDVALDEQFPDDLVARLDAIASRLAKLDEWDESAHPRAENGQFGEGGGGSKKESSGGGSKKESANTRDLTSGKPPEGVDADTWKRAGDPVGEEHGRRRFGEGDKDIHSKVKANLAEMTKHAGTFKDEQEAYNEVAKKFGGKEAQVWRALTREGRNRESDENTKQAEPAKGPFGRQELLKDGPGFRGGSAQMGGDPDTKMLPSTHKPGSDDNTHVERRGGSTRRGDALAQDLHNTRAMPNSVDMTLDEALARIQDLETKLDAFEAAAPAGPKCETCDGAMVEGEDHECAPKMDAADAARIEGERDAARQAADEAKAALSAATEAHTTELAKVRKDADDSVNVKVRESLDVLSKAVMVMGKDVKIKLDGKDVDMVDAPLRAVKCAVIKHLKGKTIEAKKHDVYVDALFEDAIEAFNPGAKSLAAAKAVVEDNGRKDAVEAPATAKDPEAAAAEVIKNRYATAWMADKS